MSLRGPIAFLLFWLVALAAGSALVWLVLGGHTGWLVLTAAGGIAVALIGGARVRRRR